MVTVARWMGAPTPHLFASLVVASALSLAAAPGASAVQVRIAPPSPRQGDAALVVVAGARDAKQIEGSFGGRSLHFFPYGDEHAAVAGIDLADKAGKAAWQIGVLGARGAATKASGTVVVRAAKFPVQRLTLPAPMVDLDPETERRAAGEAARLRAIYETSTPERLWRGRFTRPLGGDAPGTAFGSRRIINGQPRNPHSGVDFAADLGAPVLASNRGRVALIADFFFAGRLVVLDHGLGLYTLYFHLDRIDVSEGAVVERGEAIGAVGATGRATGPHLHWGAQLGAARVDPRTLLSLPIRD